MNVLSIIILSFLSVVFGNEFLGIWIEGRSLFGFAIINQTKTDTETSIGGTHFNIDPLEGAIMIIIAIAVATAFVGIKVLGSGLSDPSVRVLITATAYTGLWLVLSVLASPLLFEIEVFGSLIYVSLSIIYVIGVIEKMTGVG